MKRVLPPLLATLIFFMATLPVIAATYVVEQGDTLYSIATRYGTTVDTLKAANGLTSDVIWIGQTLQVGTSSPQPSTGIYHTVVRGDTLYALARRYGTTVDAVMQTNGLTRPNIYVGQRLMIGSSSVTPVGSTTYTVVRGDTLYSIARRYGTTVETIKAVNGLSGRLIYIGQRLLIPSISIPTASATPTVTPTPMNVIIESINFDGLVPDAESDEYAVITNAGTTSQNIGGWRLHADDPGQDFTFPNFELMPGQICRVYTNEVHTEYCGFSFGRGSAIWNNIEGDCGRLFDASDVLVSTYCYKVD